MLTRAPSAEFSGLTLRARARPAGTRDWLERACPAAAASATHHGRVPTHAVTRREGRGLCSPHWARKPRRGRAKAAAGYSSLALPTRDRRGSLFRSASTGPNQSQVPSSGSRGGPSKPEKQAPARSAQPAQPATRRQARTYLAGGVSRTDRPPQSRGAAEASPGAQRTQAAASSAGAAQLRHPDPAGDFHLLPGTRGIAQRKWPGRTAARFPLFPLSHCQGGGKWRSASPKAWITPIGPVRRPRWAAHTRGRGRARSHSNQRVGGRALRAAGARPP